MANPSTQSTVKVQHIISIAQTFGDIEPVLNRSGSSAQPALTICNDVFNAICAVDFPHKWNEIIMPQFYTNSWQQDYAGIYLSGPLAGQSITNLSWLERGMVISINNTAIPKPWRYVECGRQLPQQTGSLYNSATLNPAFLVNWYPNYMLYYGTWGAANTGNSTVGNNPVANSVYISPFTPNGNMPQNPITQIQDANGNYLVLTTYGHEGSAAPLAAANSPAGTTASGSGATTVWTVVDPQGYGFRILPAPSGTGVVWQFNLVGQMKPMRFTSTEQTLYPLPDEFEPHFRAGFIAQCYRYSPETKIRQKFRDEWNLWLASLESLRSKQDRELEENMFVPDRGVMGGYRSGASRFLGPSWPFNYPIN